jgi:hypothetical protein
MSVIAITIRRDAQRYRWLCCRVRIKLVVSLYPAPESIRPSRESSDARLEAEGKGLRVSDLLLFAIFLLAYVALMKWVLPALGVPT